MHVRPEFTATAKLRINVNEALSAVMFSGVFFIRRQRIHVRACIKEFLA